MRQRSYSFVRAERRRWGLTQAELALLLGIDSPTTVSRIERAVRPPTAAVMVACGILFGLPHAELFASFHEAVEEIVVNAAKALYDELDGKTDPRSLRKRDFLEEVLRRITSAGSSTTV